MKNNVLLFVLLYGFSTSAQKEKLDKPYTSFREKVVLYSDCGFASGPFSIEYPFSKDISRIRYRNNYNPVIGIGGAYKWFSLRLNFALNGTSRSVSRFGNSSYFGLGFNFQVKKWYVDVDFENYNGYAIRDAYRWNDTLNKLKPNDIRAQTNAANFTMDAFYFTNKNFVMSSVMGKTGHYEKQTTTWYVKPTLAVHGISNNNKTILPEDLINLNDDKTKATVLSAFEVGIIPGYAYVNRINNWQFCGFLGFGGVLQTKFYSTVTSQRGFLGLAPRYDVRLIGGYSTNKYFAFLNLDFDNKSIRFGNLRYRHSFYTFRITTGIRIN